MRSKLFSSVAIFIISASAYSALPTVGNMQRRPRALTAAGVADLRATVTLMENMADEKPKVGYDDFVKELEQIRYQCSLAQLAARRLPYEEAMQEQQESRETGLVRLSYSSNADALKFKNDVATISSQPDAVRIKVDRITRNLPTQAWLKWFMTQDPRKLQVDSPLRYMLTKFASLKLQERDQLIANANAYLANLMEFVSGSNPDFNKCISYVNMLGVPQSKTQTTHTEQL